MEYSSVFINGFILSYENNVEKLHSSFFIKPPAQNVPSWIFIHLERLSNKLFFFYKYTLQTG